MDEKQKAELTKLVTDWFAAEGLLSPIARQFIKDKKYRKR